MQPTRPNVVLNQPITMKKSKIKSFLLRFGISCAAMGLILYAMRGNLGETLNILKTEVNWGWFAIGFLFYVTANVILTFRLRVVFAVQSIHLTYKETLNLVFTGLFFNLFLPSAVGGDIAKGYYAYQHSGKKIESTTSVIIDRLLGFAAMIVTALVAVLVFNKEIQDPRLNMIIYFFVAVMLLCVVFLLNKAIAHKFIFLGKLIPSEKLKQKIGELYNSFNSYRHHPGTLLGLIVLSFLGQLFYITTYFWAAKSLDVDMALTTFFVVVPLISIVAMAPSLGGLGVREAGSIYLFSRFMTPERALAISLLIDMIVYGLSFISGIIYSLKGGLKRGMVHDMEEQMAE